MVSLQTMNYNSNLVHLVMPQDYQFDRESCHSSNYCSKINFVASSSPLFEMELAHFACSLKGLKIPSWKVLQFPLVPYLKVCCYSGIGSTIGMTFQFLQVSHQTIGRKVNVSHFAQLNNLIGDFTTNNIPCKSQKSLGICPSLVRVYLSTCCNSNQYK